MQKLAIIETDDSGQCTGIIREIEPCTLDEWEQMQTVIFDNGRKARLYSENEARLTLILQGMTAAGIFEGNQINLQSVIDPYVMNSMAQAEQRKGLAAKFDNWKKRTKAKLVSSLVKQGLSFVQSLGTKLIKSSKP